jgi:excisionase family DNA binding protein
VERTDTPDPSPSPFLTVEEAAAVLGISRTLAYALAREYLATRATGLPCVRLGARRIVVSRRTLDRFADPIGRSADPKDAA